MGKTPEGCELESRPWRYCGTKMRCVAFLRPVPQWPAVSRRFFPLLRTTLPVQEVASPLGGGCLCRRTSRPWGALRSGWRRGCLPVVLQGLALSRRLCRGRRRSALPGPCAPRSRTPAHQTGQDGRSWPGWWGSRVGEWPTVIPGDGEGEELGWGRVLTVRVERASWRAWVGRSSTVGTQPVWDWVRLRRPESRTGQLRG